MLRIIESFGHKPVQVNIDKDCEFLPGQIVSLKLKKDKETLDVCDGLYPYGIVDDIHATKFRNIVYEKLISLKEVPSNRCIELHPNIIKSSLKYKIYDFIDNKNLNIDEFYLSQFIDFKAGKICFPEKYIIPNYLTITISYAYNTTLNYPLKLNTSCMSTQSATVWKNNMIVETDMFDVTQTYTKYANLYVENGFLTTKINNELCKCVGTLLCPPTSSVENTCLRYLFDPYNNVNIGNG